MDACLQEFEAQHGFSLARGTTLLAISGGLDSMVLLHLFAKASYPIAVAHVNFGLRGEASQADETLVCETCEALEIPYHVLRPDTQAYAAEHRLSTQMAARDLRYGFFEELMRDFGYVRLATAHHADDALETLFIYLLRNNGRAALTGIEALRENRLRPLRRCTKEELLQFAMDKKLQWRDDESNASVKYLRNKVRHWLVPALKEAYPEIIADFLELSQGMSSYYKAQDQQLREAMLPFILYQSSEKVEISKTILQHPKKEQIFDYYGRSLGFVKEPTRAILEAQVGAQLQAVGTAWQLQVLHDRFRFIRGYEKAEYEKSIQVGEYYSFVLGGFQINISWEEGAVVAGDNEYIFGIDEVGEDILLRSCRTGDTMSWKQSSTAKKLSDVFTDAHISAFDRWTFPLIELGGEVVGIVGLKRSDLYRTTAATQQSMRISWEKLPT